MSVVGLDFGNQNAVIAVAGRGGVDVSLNGGSNRLNASMVGFKDSRSMGEAASITANSNFKNTIRNIKRLIGLPFNDPRAQAEIKRANFACVPIPHANGGPDSIGAKINFNNEEKVVCIEAAAGMLVKHMGEIVATNSAASSTADKKDLFPNDWVITIPGYYTDSQRRALLDGMKIAGIEGVQRLMHEHTATALAYGIFKDIRQEFNKEQPSNVMFIDLGETSYSCCIASFEPGKLIIKSTNFDADLGGRDFDLKIAEWIATQFETKYKGKLSGKPMERPKTLLKLLAAAEKAKKTLSPAGVKEARMSIEMLMDDYDYNCKLSAEEYEEMCAPLLARLNPPIQAALAETGLKPSDLSSIEIVGGGSRVGCVKRTLAKILGLDETATNNGLSTTLNADEAIARGAALQSAILSPRFKVLPYEIVECTPFPVKVSWDGDSEGSENADGNGINSVTMFDRGSNFNVVRRVTLRRSGEFIVKASYDESASKYSFPEGVDKNIVTFKIQAPPTPASGEENKVRVNIKQDIHGSIFLSSAQMVEEVVVEDEEMKDDATATTDAAATKDGEEAKSTADGEASTATKTEKKKKVKKTNLEFTQSRPLDWTKAELDAYYEEEVAMANIDRIVKETSHMRNELESYVYDMRDKIISESQLAPFATSEEKSAFSDLLEKTENWLYEEGFDATKTVYGEKLNALQKHGNPIQMRQREGASRPGALTQLQRTVERYECWINTNMGQEGFVHVTDEEWTKFREACDSSSTWMYDAMDKQGSLSANQNPFVTTDQINSKINELTKTVSPIMHKPKPKPKVEEKKETPAPATAEGDKPAEGEKAAEPMDTDEASTPAEEGDKTEPMDTA